ncbi:hypothetical protein D3C78_1504250 [compost metagenome]
MMIFSSSDLKKLSFNFSGSITTSASSIRNNQAGASSKLTGFFADEKSFAFNRIEFTNGACGFKSAKVLNNA